MIIEKLYAGQPIPLGTDPARVKQVELELRRRLARKMKESYSWFAICTVAVEAGIWGGNRRVKKREKLLSMINVCRAFLGEAPVRRKKGWAMKGLKFGYGACQTPNETRTALCIGLMNKLVRG